MMLLTSCMLFVSHSGNAQEKTLTGKIISSDGTAIQGVTIQEKGARNLAVSDAVGNYSIKISKPGAVLIFSFVGYATQEIAAADGPLNITLLPGASQLNEIIVTAMGIRKEA